jgi:hypothetical protein
LEVSIEKILTTKTEFHFNKINQHMQKDNFIRAGVLTLLMTFALVLSYELWLRHRGYSISYDDDERLWATTRAEVYQPVDQAVVFIGSSRIKFDLDIPTWKNETGTNAVQLAMVGSNPRPLLHNLAEDKNFKGRLVVDVTEVLFFNDLPPFQVRPTKGINFYKKETPSEKVSSRCNEFLESNLVLLDKDFFALEPYLKKFHFANRKGVQSNDGPPFPWEFDLTQKNRQSGMSDQFVQDTNLQNQVRAIWFSLGRALNTPPPTGSRLDSILMAVKTDVDKIRSRGGDVIFVRTPSSGPFLEGEAKSYPKENYWDKILAKTNCPGIYFRDYESLSHFQCPEFSHLSPADAKIYTKSLVQILQQKGWKFQNAKTI